MPYGNPKFSVFFNPLLFLPALALISSPARCYYTPSFQLTEHLISLKYLETTVEIIV